MADTQAAAPKDHVTVKMIGAETYVYFERLGVNTRMILKGTEAEELIVATAKALGPEKCAELWRRIAGDGEPPVLAAETAPPAEPTNMDDVYKSVVDDALSMSQEIDAQPLDDQKQRRRRAR